MSKFGKKILGMMLVILSSIAIILVSVNLIMFENLKKNLGKQLLNVFQI